MWNSISWTLKCDKGLRYLNCLILIYSFLVCLLNVAFDIKGDNTLSLIQSQFWSMFDKNYYVFGPKLFLILLLDTDLRQRWKRFTNVTEVANYDVEDFDTSCNKCLTIMMYDTKFE